MVELQTEPMPLHFGGIGDDADDLRVGIATITEIDGLLPSDDGLRVERLKLAAPEKVVAIFLKSNGAYTITAKFARELSKRLMEFADAIESER